MDPEQEAENSVFDFLYVDRQRLGSLLAQLSDDGVITSAKRTSSTTGSNSGEVKVGTALVASVGGAMSDAATEALEHQFDPSFLLPINALTVLADAGRIKTGGAAALGSIVRVNGTLILRDLDLIQRIWSPMIKMILNETPAKDRAKRKEQMDIAGAVLKDLPATVQVILHAGDARYWGMLNESDPTFSSHFIGLKHGTTLQGEWYVVGILDALPGAAVATTESGSGDFFAGLSGVLEGMRGLIGRPDSCYGITPLAIFRPCGEP